MLFHGSSIQNLKFIQPSKINTDSYIFSTPSIIFAAIHCISGGWRVAKFDSNLKVKINRSDVHLLNKPCSIYQIDSRYSKLDKDFNLSNIKQYISHDRVKVLKEIKYSSVRECWMKNGVNY